MNTTAFGLMSAIPMLLIHSLLQTKTNEIVDSFEMAGIKVLNLLSDGSGNKPVAQPQAQNASASAQVATPAGSPA
jgi:hypothetical protein